MGRLQILSLCVYVASIFWNAALSAQEIADLAIVHAQLLTPAPSSHDTLLVRGQHIVAVGSLAELQSRIGPGTLQIDARGHSVTPGLNDAHVHFLSGSRSLAQVDLAETSTVEEVDRRIADFIAQQPKLDFVQGRGWVYGAFEGGLPHRELLDRLIPDRPASMRCYDGHTLWVNTAALKAAKITRETPDPEGGIIVRDAQGEPTGVLKESAQRLIDPIIPKPSRSESLLSLRAGIAAAHRFGVTSVQEAGVGRDELELFEALRAEGGLNLRMAIALEGRPKMTDSDLDQLESLRRSFAHLDISAVKLYVDGVIEAHTAALLAPYANRPTQGLPETNQADLDRVVAGLDQRGWQIMIHAIGDGGIRMSLDAFERAQQTNAQRTKVRRHRLEHIETVATEDIGRFGKLGVIASMQPYHANPNGNVFNVWAVNLGAERASRAWAWKSIQDAGGQLAFGSDWPVVSIDPRLGMHTALTRQTLSGEPPQGFLPQQRLSLQDVLRAYTTGAARAQNAESEKGSLAPGMLADIVIWNADLTRLPVDQVARAEVVTTVFDGRVVYRRD